MDGVQYTKIGVMWTLKHEIISPIFYEILIKTELKGDTALKRGPSQDAPFGLILWYIVKTIPTLLEWDQFVM